MRLVTYEFWGCVRSGVVVDDWVVDLERAYQHVLEERGTPAAARRAAGLLPTSLKKVLESGTDGLVAASEVVSAARAARGKADRSWEERGIATPLDRARLWAPIRDPDKIICMGRNYRAHAEEGGGVVPESPELFAKFANALVGHNWPIELPAISDEVDYEAELAVVIGRRAKDVSAAEALEYVAGYTILHDVSARDYQLRTSQWLPGKGMDTFAPMGPWIVTTDEIPDPQKLQITLELGGQVLQNANTSTMVFSVAESISYISRVMTLEAGDVISTGTPEGVGFVRKPPIYLKAGDVVNITIDGIGTLSNPVVGPGRGRERAAEPATRVGTGR
jgi:acylpyruvate hydrolase